jgi:sulfide:quinone oxidoreductase
MSLRDAAPSVGSNDSATSSAPVSGHRQRPRVVVAGGGVAALETLLALRALAGHQLEITLVAPNPWFVYRPVTVGEAFDHAEAHRHPLAFIAGDHGAALVPEAVERVDAERREVVTDSGATISYDRLVVAVGARECAPFPGALTFRGGGDVQELRRLLAELESGAAKSVAFALPLSQVWSLPLYELALLTADHLRARGVANVTLMLVTPEEEPLELFGVEAARAVQELLASRAIDCRPGSVPVAVHPGGLLLAGGSSIRAERVVTLPVPEGPAVAGLPHDRHGFLEVDSHGRVRGVPGVFAAGDVTAFPVKQGGLAAQQADAVAEQITAELEVGVSPSGGEIPPRPFRPVLRGLLMTGGAPLYLRAEPERLTHPVGRIARLRDDEPYVGHGSAAVGQPLWWPPAKIAGRYLAPYLAHARSHLTQEELADREPVPGDGVSEAEQHDALELGLMLADLDARFGDYRSALQALDAAEAVQGALPPEYEARRRRWRQADWTA